MEWFVELSDPYAVRVTALVFPEIGAMRYRSAQEQCRLTKNRAIRMGNACVIHLVATNANASLDS
jgi:hypothetical protein